MSKDIEKEVKAILNSESTDFRSFVGEKIQLNDDRWLKIMAYSDNYYMIRYKGCVPSCKTGAELKKLLKAYLK